MPELRSAGFHHITMVSSDAARTLAFYRGLLGIGLVKRTVNFDDPGAWHLYFGDDGGRPGTLLTFFEWSHARRGHWGVGGIHHLALGVKDRAAQLKWKRRLTDAGVNVSGPIDRGYFTSLYFADPDGQVLEIATAGPGYDIDEPMASLGSSLIQPPSERLPDGRDRDMLSRTHPEPVPVITDDMRLQGIHHITGITNDLERASDFYVDALGLPLIKRTLNQDDATAEHWFWANWDGASVGPHSSMTLFGWPNSNYPARPGTGQTHHIAFRAKDAEEQLAWRAHLLEREIQVTEVLDRNYFSSIYFRSPDGLLHEIATDGPGFAIDEEEDRLGEELRLPDWLEPRRDEISAALGELEATP